MTTPTPIVDSNIVNTLIQKLSSLPTGTETTLSDLMDRLYTFLDYQNGVYCYRDLQIDDMTFCELDRQVRQAARKAGILMDDSAYAQAVVGMSFHCPFVVRHAK